MMGYLESASHRFERFAETVIAPAVHPRCLPLTVSVAQCSDPIAPGSVPQQDFHPVERGWRWGPVWSTAWFRLEGVVPDSFDDGPIGLRFSSGTEALLYLDGVPHQGFDRNRDWALLPNVTPGTPVTLYVEAACNHPLGATQFWWDERELDKRWSEERPGRLECCELATRNEPVARLLHTYTFARLLMRQCADDSPRGQRLCRALEDATRTLTAGNVTASADAVRAGLAAALGPASTGTECITVGHAHIDTAWLWRIRETRRKCRRSFASVLRLMERYPAFLFLCSQAQQYAWIEDDAPELFEAIRQRVAEGRWEPGGAMWIEPDCSIPSGESLIRQILYGTEYFTSRFGAAGAQRHVFLPDTFGFPASLPQIMVGAGLDTFIANKLAWNQVNEFPHTTFRWRGIDGTDILTHFTPGREYNATNTPQELQKGESVSARTDRLRTGVWLQPFGYGDGGGGPTDWMIEYADLAGDTEGLPRVRHGLARDFCGELHARAARAGELPVWDGELYLEAHRGTLTSQAWLKRQNRMAEVALRQAEWLEVCGPDGFTPPDAERKRSLDAAWSRVLLNQFHDILPGSSIREVYKDARQDYADANEHLGSVAGPARDRWCRAFDTSGMTDPVLVLNPQSVSRDEVLRHGARTIIVRDVPAMGARVVDRAAAPDVAGVTATADRLVNQHLDIRVDGAGRIESLIHTATGRDVYRVGEPLNQLVLYEDIPRFWEAWDIDAEYTAKPEVQDGHGAPVVTSMGGLGEITIERRLGEHSSIRQTFRLQHDSPRLDIETEIDWHERRRLLRAVFPTNLRSRKCTCGIQFGAIERAAHASSSIEAAAFEFCVHRWIDFSEPDFGVAVLNTGLYGHSCLDGTIGVSLLRGTSFPDPAADQGQHRFSYSIMPHAGDWRNAGVTHEAQALNDPMQVIELESNRDTGVRAWAPFSLHAGSCHGLEVVAFKRAVDGGGAMLRLVETHGVQCDAEIEWHSPVASAESADLLERPVDEPGITHDRSSARTTLSFRPFQIRTIRVRST